MNDERSDPTTLAAIRTRRSIKQFTDRPVARAEIERMLDLAVLAPNHRMTQPWHFYVLGPESRRAYAEVRAALKSAKVENAEAAELVRAKVRTETERVPAMIVVTMEKNADPEIREEDYAATFMAIQNLLIAANAAGLGGYIHTGRILTLPELRGPLGIPEGRRIVALLDIGEPAEVPTPKERAPAAERTTWLP